MDPSFKRKNQGVLHCPLPLTVQCLPCPLRMESTLCPGAQAVSTPLTSSRVCCSHTRHLTMLFGAFAPAVPSAGNPQLPWLQLLSHWAPLVSAQMAASWGGLPPQSCSGCGLWGMLPSSPHSLGGHALQGCLCPWGCSACTGGTF